MVLMDMAHHHQFGGVEFGADGVRDDRGVERCAGVRTADENLVSARVFPVLVAEEDRDPTEVGALDRFANARLVRGCGCDVLLFPSIEIGW
jgi:hypothetical protein